MNYEVEVDARGLRCPLPVLKAWMRLKAMSSGQVLRIVATDRGTTQDFPAFIGRTQHHLLETAQAQGEYIYLIRKA